jgi:hypothetical protein
MILGGVLIEYALAGYPEIIILRIQLVTMATAVGSFCWICCAILIEFTLSSQFAFGSCLGTSWFGIYCWVESFLCHIYGVVFSLWDYQLQLLFLLWSWASRCVSLLLDCICLVVTFCLSRNPNLLVDIDGVRRYLWTAATNRPVVHPSVDIWYREPRRNDIDRETEELGENLP